MAGAAELRRQQGRQRVDAGMAGELLLLETPELLEPVVPEIEPPVRGEDADRLAIKTGLGIKKARQVQQGAIYFLENEARAIEAARSQLPAHSENKAAFAAAEMPKE